MLGAEDIKEGLHLLLTEPQAPAISRVDETAVDVDQSSDGEDSEVLTNGQVASVLSRVAAEADPESNGISFQVHSARSGGRGVLFHLGF